MVKKVVILASGEGTNLQSVIDKQGNTLFNINITGLVSNKICKALDRAKASNIPYFYFPWDKNSDDVTRLEYDKNLAYLILFLKPDAIILLGWDHILSKNFLDSFIGVDILNLHPALLNTFPGNNAIEDAYNAFKEGHCSSTGVMVHRVTDELDVGEVISEKVVIIDADETLESLKTKIQICEKDVVSDALNKISTGYMFSGKVKEIYKIHDDKMLIIHTDRLSAFNKGICNVKYKGVMLAKLSKWWFDTTSNIIDNHVILQNDSEMLVKKCELIPVEFIVRGYITGSLWKHYSNGHRNYCGIEFKDGLIKNQQLDAEIITPTTKDKDDLPISYEDILERNILTKNDLDYIYSICQQLFTLGKEVSSKNNLILVDTKYEFGRDKDGKIILIDEIHTIESSRYWVLDTYDKNMSEGKEPEKLDKDNLRDYIVDYKKTHGIDADIPENIKEKIINCYKEVYEKISGDTVILNQLKNFEGTSKEIQDTLEIYNNLEIDNYKIVILSGSVKDNDHVNNIKLELDKHNLKYCSYVYSAHKNTTQLIQLLNIFNNLNSRIIYITVAGRSNALSGVVACNTNDIVIACPPIKDTNYQININSTLQMPSGTPVLTVLDPNNVGLACNRILRL